MCVLFPHFFLVSFALFFLFCFSQLRVYLCLFLCVVYSVYILFIFFNILLACLNIAGWGLLFIVLDCFLISLYGLYLDVVSQFWQCCRERDLKIKQKRTCSFCVILVFLFLFFAKVYYIFCLLLCSVTALKSLGFCMFISSFFWYSVSV